MRVLTGDRRGPRTVAALALCGLLVLGLGVVRAGADEQERFGRRRQMLSLTNQDRERRDRAELRFAARLSRYAREHSRLMARRGAIFHSTPDQLRAQLGGYTWSIAGENVGVGGSLESLEAAFMNSPSHRENILRTSFAHAAVGVARDDDGHIWVTVIFYG
jgi:uncharacterized protein YkwD